MLTTLKYGLLSCVCMSTHSKQAMHDVPVMTGYTFKIENEIELRTHKKSRHTLHSQMQYNGRWNCVMKISHTLHASLLGKKGQHINRSDRHRQRDLKKKQRSQTLSLHPHSHTIFPQKYLFLFDFMFAVAVVLSFSVPSIALCFDCRVCTFRAFE